MWKRRSSVKSARVQTHRETPRRMGRGIAREREQAASVNFSKTKKKGRVRDDAALFAFGIGRFTDPVPI